MAVNKAYKLGENTLIFDNIVFWFDNGRFSEQESFDDVLLRFLREGYLDLRHLIPTDR